MKKFILAIPALVLCMGLNAQETARIPDTQKEKMQGKVKELAHRAYYVSLVDGHIVPDEDYEESTYTEKFNRSGYITVGDYQLHSGNYRHILSFDKDNNLREEYFEEGEESDNEDRSYTYEINNGMTIRRNTFHADTHYLQTEYEYDAQGRLSKKTILDPEEDLRTVQTVYYTWSEDGKTRESLAYDGDGSTIDYSGIDLYDDRGNLIQHSQVTYYSKTLETNIYKYDEAGNQTYCYETESDYGELTTRIYHRTFDQYGNVTYEKGVRNGSEDITTTEYVYDEEGNWIRRVSMDGEERIPYLITERSFKYYRK